MTLTALFLATALGSSQEYVVYESEKPNGKHIVLLAGDEEYRSEEAMPQLAKILAYRHGFRCTVLFSIGAGGYIDPETRDNQPGLESLRDAHLCIMMLRFRNWPDRQMRWFDEYLQSGKPVLALRTSTHAFDITSGEFTRYGVRGSEWSGGFGKHVLGETWVSHWGVHGKQGTRGVLVSRHPILEGVEHVFGTTDVYEAHPPLDSEILLRGEVVDGMTGSHPAAAGKKSNALGAVQEINDPMMPIAWIREYRNEAGRLNRIVTCTMGSATDLLNDGFKRFLVNAACWLAGTNVPPRANVAAVGEYDPSPFGFGGFRRGVRPADLAGR